MELIVTVFFRWRQPVKPDAPLQIFCKYDQNVFVTSNYKYNESSLKITPTIKIRVRDIVKKLARF